MGRGAEWEYVEELTPGKTTSHLRCKSCGHTFHGNATRIKEHLFNNGVNVIACTNPPSDIHVRLSKYSQKLRVETHSVRKKPLLGIPSSTAEELNGCNIPSNEFENHSSQQTHNPTPSHFSYQTQSSSAKSRTLHEAFDKQSLLELH